MLDDERMTQPLLGARIVAYVLGELDAEERKALEEKIEADPELRREVEEIRSHLRLHQDVRTVAPRRGSFQRLSRRMQQEGAFDGAIPGVHQMLRRAFFAAALFGVVAVVLLARFPSETTDTQPENVVGQVIFRVPATNLEGDPGRETETVPLVAGVPVDTGNYDAVIWLPTGYSNAYSTLECEPGTEFEFVDARTVKLTRGAMRRLEIMQGGVDEPVFRVVTPQATVSVRQAMLAVQISADGAQTQVAVGEGSAAVADEAEQGTVTVSAGYFSTVMANSLPAPARSVLDLSVVEKSGPTPTVEVTLRNVSFLPVRVRRVYSRDPVYLMTISQAPDYDDERPEGARHPPRQIYPMPGESGSIRDHQGSAWLQPKEAYRFTADLSGDLLGLPRVVHWLTFEYRGDLYGPQGSAPVSVRSVPLRLDMRDR